MHNIDYNL